MTAPVEAAVRMARRGWAVLPCHSPSGLGCSCHTAGCSSPGKHPRTRQGLHDASTDPVTIRAWWGRWPEANVAVRTGAVSGLVVLDIDPEHGGLDTIRRLHADTPLPAGLRVRTGSGGWHLYFAHPGGMVRNSAGTVLGPGVDVRGDGGYVIAPPSRHVSGGSYRWHGPLVLPELPDELLERLRPARRSPTTMSRPVRLDESSSAWARAALVNEAAEVRSAAPGGRNHRLNRAAFSLGQIAGAGLLDSGDVIDQLRDAALGAGLGAREAASTIRSGLRAGLRFPRTPTRATIPDPEPDRSLDVSAEL